MERKVPFFFGEGNTGENGAVIYSDISFDCISSTKMITQKD